MASIKNGSFTGTVPDKTVFAVNYPGYPTSIDRAVETLGGKDAISKARQSEANFLELRFRPEDTFAHPVFGELRSLSGLVLELSKRKDSQDIKANVVAKVDQCYEFNGMADYQYVAPVHINIEKRRKRRRMQSLHGENIAFADVDQEDIMLLPPPLFSVKDMPEELVLHPSEISRATHRQALLSQQSWEMEIVPCFNLDFKIKEVPPKTNWEERLEKNSGEWVTQSAVAKLFEERPIWAKSTINDRLVEKGICLTDVQLRRFLFRLSYYFAYGPFRKLWIKNGYDPRKDLESRMYQMIDFRVPKSVRKAAQARLIEKGEAAASITWSDICSFKEAPLKKFSYLCLYDLDDEYIQEQIRRPAEQSTCNEYTGWFNRSTITRLRHHIRVRFLSLIPGDMTRELEEIEIKRLNALKRADYISRTRPRPQDASEEPAIDNVDAIPQEPDLNAVNSNDEEEEDDDDDEEDEDDYQPLEELAFGSTAQTTDGYMDSLDNIPKSYLQELLEKFPLNAGENVRGVRDVDLSDEEAGYDIFDQDEDEDEEEDD